MLLIFYKATDAELNLSIDDPPCRCFRSPLKLECGSVSSNTKFKPSLSCRERSLEIHPTRQGRQCKLRTFVRSGTGLLVLRKPESGAETLLA